MTDKPRQPRPRGTWWPVDEDWKRDTKADMKKAGVSQSELARRIGCNRGGVSVLFRPATRMSRLVGPIHEVLGRPPPAPLSAFNEDLHRLNDAWPALTKEQQGMLKTLAEQLAGKAPH